MFNTAMKALVEGECARTLGPDATLPKRKSGKVKLKAGFTREQDEPQEVALRSPVHISRSQSCNGYPTEQAPINYQAALDPGGNSGRYRRSTNLSYTLQDMALKQLKSESHHSDDDEEYSNGYPSHHLSRRQSCQSLVSSRHSGSHISGRPSEAASMLRGYDAPQGFLLGPPSTGALGGPRLSWRQSTSQTGGTPLQPSLSVRTSQEALCHRKSSASGAASSLRQSLELADSPAPEQGAGCGGLGRLRDKSSTSSRFRHSLTSGVGDGDHSPFSRAVLAEALGVLPVQPPRQPLTRGAVRLKSVQSVSAGRPLPGQGAAAAAAALVGHLSAEADVQEGQGQMIMGRLSAGGPPTQAEFQFQAQSRTQTDSKRRGNSFAGHPFVTAGVLSSLDQ